MPATLLMLVGGTTVIVTRLLRGLTVLWSAELLVAAASKAPHTRGVSWAASRLLSS